MYPHPSLSDDEIDEWRPLANSNGAAWQKSIFRPILQPTQISLRMRSHVTPNTKYVLADICHMYAVYDSWTYVLLAARSLAQLVLSIYWKGTWQPILQQNRRNWPTSPQFSVFIHIYRVVQKKRGHSTFSQISRKLLKISK